MSSSLSDYTAKKSIKQAHKSTYADLDLNLKLHPNTSDVKPLLDLNAVKNAIKNLLMTNYGDRPFQPSVGSNITGLLFEPSDSFTSQGLQLEIKHCLEKFESRISGVRVEVLDDSDNNRYAVTVGFNVLFSNNDEEINFYLERLR